MHVIVENQLAGGNPPAVQDTLERFSQAGLTRHEAIHAIGSVMAEAILNITRHKTAFDREAAVRALARLQPDVWRFAPPR
jgi:predicted secreted Zn-dependent protease